MEHPKPYPPISPIAYALYDYQDIIDGTGIVEFSLCQEEDSTGAGYLLTTKTIYSSELDVEALANAVTPTDTQEFNFDVTFVTPRTIKGDIYANIMWRCSNADSNGTFKVSVEAMHYDGSTETTIGSSVDSPTETAYNTSLGGSWLIKIPNTEEIHFKKGEILRLELTLVATRTSSVTYAYVGTDPAGRDFGNAPTSNSKLLVPFKRTTT